MLEKDRMKNTMFFSLQCSQYLCCLLNNRSKIYNERFPNSLKWDYFLGSIHKNVMWKNTTSPNVSEVFLLTQAEVLEQLSISHSVLSFSPVIYNQYTWRFSWESKWQEQIFLGDFMKSLGLFLFMALPENREKKKRMPFLLSKGPSSAISVPQVSARRECAHDPISLFYVKRWVETVICNPGVWLQQRSECLNCFLNGHEGADLFTGCGQCNHLFWDQLILFSSRI